ncbi:hypothetical protein WMY93_031386 [Mugilogobius chulae]|uniref:Peptidase S1 domain-containing protein n=1 Tax=Mugilogobius chulae TaxID=88201 RepID=A0AAW0MDQ0_9GOBI
MKKLQHRSPCVELINMDQLQGFPLPLERDLRIVGGFSASPHAVSYIVSLRTSEGVHYCGGAIIQQYWVITAAHCNLGLNNMLIVAEKPSVRVRGSEQRVAALRLVPHPEYNSTTSDNDIMLIKLQWPLRWTEAVTPVCLPRAGSVPAAGRLCEVSGWGFTSLRAQAPSSDLQQVSVSVISSAACNSSLSFNGTVTSNMICAGDRDGGKTPARATLAGLWCAAHSSTVWSRGAGPAERPGIPESTPACPNTEPGSRGPSTLPPAPHTYTSEALSVFSRKPAPCRFSGGESVL